MSKNQRASISIESMRKNFLTLLLKRKDITVIETDTRMTKEIVCDGHSDCLYDMQLNLITEAECELPEKDIEPSLINATLQEALDELVDLDLSIRGIGKAKIETGNHTTLLNTLVYRITPKGLDVALKLQEHTDNEQRFKQQIDISEQQKGISNELKINSSKSVVNARIALALSIVLIAVGGYRIYQLEQKILSHSNMEQRIQSAEEESSRLDEEVVRLKGELSRLISVDNDKGKPVAVIVDSNTPATAP